jgi:hypothetical protein
MRHLLRKLSECSGLPEEIGTTRNYSVFRLSLGYLIPKLDSPFGAFCLARVRIRWPQPIEFWILPRPCATSCVTHTGFLFLKTGCAASQSLHSFLHARKGRVWLVQNKSTKSRDVQDKFQKFQVRLIKKFQFGRFPRLQNAPDRACFDQIASRFYGFLDTMSLQLCLIAPCT